MEIGEEWIYRLRDYAPSERVKVLVITPTKQQPRVEVEFLDGSKAGRREVIPSIRLRDMWTNAEMFDAKQAHWASITGFVMSDIEDSALYTVFREVIPEDVAELVWSPVQRAVSIHQVQSLEELTSISLKSVTDRVTSFMDEDDLILAPEGAMLIAELVSRANAQPILDWVTAEEMAQQDLVTNGEVVTSFLDGEEYHYSSQQKYRHYLKYYRPLYELLRQWCGHRAVTAQERVDAAEAEVGRLNDLIAASILEFERRGENGYAEQLKRDFHDDRISPWNVRPIINRPLEIDEMPVRYIERRRSWPR